VEEIKVEKYWVSLSNEERESIRKLIQKGGKGYRIKHAQILLKLDQKIENVGWTYEQIKAAYSVSNGTIAGVAKRFVLEGMEAALGRKKREYPPKKVTGEVEAKICVIACSAPPEGRSRWTMQMIADELIRLEVVDYITDSTICEVMKKTKLSHGRSNSGAYRKQVQSL
jgi:transposase